MRKPDKSSPKIDYFCIVSHPHFVNYKPKRDPFLWLHCFKDDSFIIGKSPKYLMSESDFIDPIFTPQYNKNVCIDYVYVAANLFPSGYEYKGFDNFIKILPTLNKLGLKGKVIFYCGDKSTLSYPISAEERLLLESSLQAGLLQYHYGSLGHGQLMKEIASAKFVLFPNYKDCSPRIISESFINNTPVVINEAIYGGWKYIVDNKNFGSLFNVDSPESVETAINHIYTLNHNQCDLWMSLYGFKNSSRKLADIVRKHKDIGDITNLYFDEYREAFNYI